MMAHLLIAYDLLVILIGFTALSNAVVLAVRTRRNDLGNFSILHALYTLMLVILVLKKYLFVNVADYSAQAWYAISGIYQVFDFAVVLAALYYFIDAHSFRHGRKVAAGALVLMLISSGLIFSPFGATLEAEKNIIHFGAGYWMAISWNAVAFTSAMVLGYWLMFRKWGTQERTFVLGLVLFASTGYVESVISFFGDFGAASATLTMERGFLYSSIPYALYGMFLIVYFVRFPVVAPLQNEEPSAAFLSKHGITDREREIIVKVMQGKSNEEIAQELFISLATVKTHLHNIYRKIGIDSRYDLLARVRSDL